MGLPDSFLRSIFPCVITMLGQLCVQRFWLLGQGREKFLFLWRQRWRHPPPVTSTAPDKDDGFYLFPQFLYLCLYLNVYLCFIWQDYVLLFLLQFWQCWSLKMKTFWTVFSRQQRKCLTLIKRFELLRRFNWIGNNTNSTLRPGGAHFVWIRQVSKTH